MGRRPRTRGLYDAILEAFRREGKNFKAVGRLSGVDRATAANVYEHGWPTVEGAIPIRRQLEIDAALMRAARGALVEPRPGMTPAELLHLNAKELVEAGPIVREAAKRAAELEERARNVVEAAKARLEEAEKLAQTKLESADQLAQTKLESANQEVAHKLRLVDLEAKQRLADLLSKAKVDAAETMADEAQMAKFSRKAALSAVAIAALVMRDAQKIASELRQALEGKLATLSPMEAVRVMREMTRLVEAAEKAVILAMQAERLRVGQPTDVIGIQTLDASVEEREIKAKALLRAIERQKTKLAVINGGAGESRVVLVPPEANGAGHSG